jgi:ribokinase
MLRKFRWTNCSFIVNKHHHSGYCHMDPLKINKDHLRYQLVIGTGGVGFGKIFVLDDNHTMGREESRGGHFLDRKDYCKLHIITHYLKVLLGAHFSVIPASRVGGDDQGTRLVKEMHEVGLDMRYMELAANEPTLYSFCFVYPDGSGGNLTTSNAATSKVNPAFISRLEPEFEHAIGKGIVLAVPEVPLESRYRLLELGSKYQFWRVAAFTHSELSSNQIGPLLERCDLIALNLEEAEALAGLSPSLPAPTVIVDRAIRKIQSINPLCCLSITGGNQGSWCWDGKTLSHIPAIPVEIINTAGAGDAHLAGVIIGIVAGLNYVQAHQLAGIIAALKVTYEHTIHTELDSQSLRKFIKQHDIRLDAVIQKLVE